MFKNFSIIGCIVHSELSVTKCHLRDNSGNGLPIRRCGVRRGEHHCRRRCTRCIGGDGASTRRVPQSPANNIVGGIHKGLVDEGVSA